MSRLLPARIALLLGLLLPACGGDGSTDPTPSGTPASAAIAGGDGQQAAAGSAVAVAPAVIVRDADQQPVSGVKVQFTVAAGGGTIQGAAPVTDASGIARLGGWTLGASGEQRLTATVASLPAVTFHATVTAQGGTLETTIGAGGGTFEITSTGHPFRGLRLTVPAGTYGGSAALQFGIASSPALPSLPAGYRVNGAVLAITTSQLRGAKLMTLRVPISHAANEQVLLALHDPVRHVTEILPTIYRDDTLIVVATTHLRPDLLAGPGLASGLASLLATDPVGWLMPIAYPVPMPNVGTVLAAVEHWPVLDFGSATLPGGFGPAIPVMQSLAADMGLSLATLEHALATPGQYADPAQLAAAVRTHQLISTAVDDILLQYDAASKAIIQQLGILRTAGGAGALRVPFGKAQIDELANQAILATLNINHKPMPVALLRDAGGAPLFATAVSGADLSVGMLSPASGSAADLVRQAASGFQSLQLAPAGDQPPVAVGQAVPLTSFLVDFRAAATPLLTMLQASALQRGSTARDAITEQMLIASGLPSVAVEIEAALGTGFAPMEGNVVVARSASTRIRVPSIGGSSSYVLDLPATGARIADQPGTPLPLSTLPSFVAAPELVPSDVVVSPLINAVGALRQASARIVRVVKATFSIAPANAPITTPFTTIPFTADVKLPPASGYSIDWDWGDGHSDLYQDIATGSHQYVEVKDYKVIATLYGKPAHQVLAVDTVDVVANQVQHWRLNTIADQDHFFSDPDLEGESPITIPLERALALPAAAMISVMPLTVNSSELQFRTLESATWDPQQCCPPVGTGTEHDMPLGRAPASTFSFGPFFAGWGSEFWSESTTDQGAGTLTGQHIFGTYLYTVKDAGVQNGPAGAVRISATRNGTTMTGTISLWIWFVNQDYELENQPDEYRFPFTATRMR